MSGVVRGMAESSVPVESGREGESGRNELLRGPFALFGVRISAKLVRDLAKHRRSLSSRRKPDLGAEGKIKSADVVEIHRCLARSCRA